MAGANRGCYPRAASEPHEIADSNYGSHDGYLGGADQITKSHDGTVCDGVEAKILARCHAGRDEPDAVLAAIGRAMAENMGRHDGSWHWARTAPRLNYRITFGRNPSKGRGLSRTCSRRAVELVG